MKRFLPILLMAGLAIAPAGCRTLDDETTAAAKLDEEQSLVLSAQADHKATALARFSKGMMDEYNSDLSGALSNYIAAAQLDPDNEDLQMRIAVGLLQQKRQDEALASVEAFSRRQPKSQKALVCLALIYQAADQPDKVEEVYRRLIDLDPKQPEMYVDLASLYLRRGEEQKAADLLERAVRKVDQPADLLRVLGGIYVQRAAANASKPDEKKYRQSAIRTFERAVELAPDDGPFLFQLGDLYLKDDQTAKALECFDRILNKRPDNLQLREKLAARFLEAGDASATIPKLEAVQKNQPANPLLDYYLGCLHASKGETNQALACFETAVVKEPTNPVPVIKLALYQLETRASNEAVRTLSQAIERQTNDVRLVEMLAFVYFARKEYTNAMDHFARARPMVEKEDPDTVNPVYYFNYAMACQMNGRTDEAAELLNKAIEHSSVYLDAYLQYAFGQKDDSVRRASITVLEKVGQLQPDQANVYLYLGLLNSYLKEYRAALAAFEKTGALLEDSPQKEDLLDASFYFWYAAACEREGQLDRAEKLFRQCLEIDPEHAEAYNYLAYMWADKGIKLDQAYDYVQKALALEPDSGAFVDTLGWVYFMQGKCQAALNEIRRASELIPDDPTITEHLGDVLFKLGDEKQAIPYWERSFVLDPDNTNVVHKLEQHNVDLEPLRKKAEEEKQKAQNLRPETDGAAPADPSVLLLPLTGTNDAPVVDEPDEDEEDDGGGEDGIPE